MTRKWIKFIDKEPICDFFWVTDFKNEMDLYSFKQWRCAGFKEFSSEHAWSCEEISIPEVPIPEVPKEGTEKHHCICPISFSDCCEGPNGLFVTANQMYHMPVTIRVSFCPFCGYEAKK